MDKNCPVKIKDLSFSTNSKDILKKVNINFEKGKFYSIIGPNGSGKTTLIKHILKIVDSKKKTLWINNKDLTEIKNKELAKNISSVPQNTNIDFDFTAYEIVMMGRTPYQRPFKDEGEEDKAKVKEAMVLTDTWKLKDEPINNLSGGEKQRVIISRALAQDTEVIILDEPVSQLDIYHQMSLMKILKDLKKNKEITIIAVLHDLNLASSFSDYIMMLKDGEVYAFGTASEVIIEENLKKVYKSNFYIFKNPNTNKPAVLPI